MRAPGIYLKMLQQVAGGDSLLAAEAQTLYAQWGSEHAPLEAMELLLQTQRLCKIAAAGRANDAALIAALKQAVPQRWSDVPRLPAKPGREKRQVETMLEQVNPPAGASVLFSPSFSARGGAEAMVELCDRKGLMLDLDVSDDAFNTTLINALDQQEIEALSAFQMQRKKANAYAIFLRGPIREEIAAQRDSKKFALYYELAEKPYTDMRVRDEVRWILSDSPSPVEAAEENMPYEDYLEFFYDACDQPWGRVKTAQAHLIDAFNRGHTLRFTNDDGTDISMSIEGQQFANSVVARNLPGSEIFSGPIKTSVNGRIVAKGRFGTKSQGKNCRMEDIDLRVENGRVMEGTARIGNAQFQEVLSQDDARDPSDPKFEGARHFGEIGIGTNPFIRQHLRNTLLCEKIGGSFHLALGSCYGDSYLGEPCKMSNGNESALHWDLTTMLRDKGGRMYLDGHLIQKDGVWIDCPELGIDAKELDVLNRGWAAVPEAERPKYWREKLAANERAR